VDEKDLFMDASTSLASLAVSTRDSYYDLRSSQAFEVAAIGIAICHPDGRILEGNSALARLLGYELDELAGLDPWKFHHSGSDSSSRLLSDLVRGARHSFVIEKNIRRKNDSNLNGRLMVSLARDPQGNAGFLVVVMEDSTEHARLQQQLRQSEKMELVGRLATGVAHDFNNLLTGFLIYCDLLLSKLDSADPLHRHVEEMRQAGEQGSALTQQLLSVTRKNQQTQQPIFLNEIVSSSENLLRRLIGERVEFIVELDPAVGQVLADPAKIRQVLLNLALNSRDACRQDGKVCVRTRAAEFPVRSGTRLKCPAVSLSVQDNGRGMSPEIKARVFEPFFTTKKPGEGTGMGLATVSRIVAEAGGEIEITSEPDHGTRIEIFFPVCENQNSPAITAIPTPELSSPQHQTAAGDSSC
jgi:two-component system, cell cycle sensor histidine kinase and response regulator CckA